MPETNWTAILALLADSTRFPNVPRGLVQQMERCLKQGRISPAMHSLARDVERVAAAINSMFETASRHTSLTADDLLRRTGFDSHDTDPTRVETAFAEIRAINFLGADGFTNIIPLPSRPVKSADILADRGPTKYAVEVANSIYHASGRYTPEQLSKWIVGRLRGDEKDIQLANTATQSGASRRMFIGIVDTEEPVIFQTHDQFLAACNLAWEAVGSDPQFHIALVTGRVTAGYGPDDAIYPSLP